MSVVKCFIVHTLNSVSRVLCTCDVFGMRLAYEINNVKAQLCHVAQTKLSKENLSS